MELHELEERIQRWKIRQSSEAPAAVGYASSQRAAALVEEVEEDDSARAIAAAAAAEMEIEPDAIVSEDSATEMGIDQVEDRY